MARKAGEPSASWQQWLKVFRSRILPYAEPAVRWWAHKWLDPGITPPDENLLSRQMRKLSLERHQLPDGHWSGYHGDSLATAQVTIELHYLSGGEACPSADLALNYLEADFLDDMSHPGFDPGSYETWQALMHTGWACSLRDRQHPTLMAVADWLVDGFLFVEGDVNQLVPLRLHVSGLRFLLDVAKLGPNDLYVKKLREALASSLMSRWSDDDDDDPAFWTALSFPCYEFDVLAVLELTLDAGLPAVDGRWLEAYSSLVRLHHDEGQLHQRRYEAGHDHEDAWLELKYLQLARRVSSDGPTAA